MQFISIAGHHFASTESQILLKNLIVVNFFTSLIEVAQLITVDSLTPLLACHYEESRKRRNDEESPGSCFLLGDSSRNLSLRQDLSTSSESPWRVSGWTELMTSPCETVLQLFVL